MKGSYELIVFDWDGTLMNSEARIVTCIQRAAADAEVAVPSVAAARDIIGLGLDEAVGRLFPERDAQAIDRIVEAYRRHWLGNDVAEAVMFEGARQLIGKLHDRGLLLGVATGKSRRGLDKALLESGLGDFFHATRCADEAFSKPHPQMLEDILTDLGTAAADTLVIGDTEYDMQMARSAGTDAVGVGHGVHSSERLLESGASRCFADLLELSEWLLNRTDGLQMEG